MPRRVFAFLLLFLGLAACTPVTPTSVNSGETIAQQLFRLAPFLRDARFSNLLTFESPDDALFVTARGGSISMLRAFTGKGSYQLDATASQWCDQIELTSGGTAVSWRVGR